MSTASGRVRRKNATDPSRELLSTITCRRLGYRSRSRLSTYAGSIPSSLKQTLMRHTGGDALIVGGYEPALLAPPEIPRAPSPARADGIDDVRRVVYCHPHMDRQTNVSVAEAVEVWEVSAYAAEDRVLVVASVHDRDPNAGSAELPREVVAPLCEDSEEVVCRLPIITASQQVEPRNAREALPVGCGKGSTVGLLRGQSRQVLHPDRRRKVRHVVAEAYRGHVKVIVAQSIGAAAGAVDTVPALHAGLIVVRGRLHGERTTLGRRDDLDRLKREGDEAGVPAHGPAAIRGSERLGCILNDRNRMCPSDGVQLIQVAGRAGPVRAHDRLGARRDPPCDVSGIDVPGVCLDVGEDGRSELLENRVVRDRAGQRGRHDLVSWTHPADAQRQPNRRRRGIDGHDVWQGERTLDRSLEILDELSLSNQGAAHDVGSALGGSGRHMRAEHRDGPHHPPRTASVTRCTSSSVR